MRAHASLRLGNVRGTTPELLGSHRGSVCPLSVAPRVTFGALVWLGKRDSLTRPPLLPLNAGTAEPFRVSPPEAVAYQLELRNSSRAIVPLIANLNTGCVPSPSSTLSKEGSEGGEPDTHLPRQGTLASGGV